MTTYSTCIFCNRNDSKPSKEDIIPKWIAKYFPGEEFRIEDEEHQRTFGAVGHFGTLSDAPCTRCNNGWMSHLESKVQPVLGPMLKGVATTLKPVDQLLVSRWLIKTAIMYDLRSKTRKFYFTTDECRDIMRSLTVPSDTWMFLAAYLGKKSAGIQEHGVEMDHELLPQAYQAWRDVQTYSVTLLIKHVAFQVFSFRRPKGQERDQFIIESLGDWSPAEIQIWPVNNSPVAWPPSLYLDDLSVDDYTERFSIDFRHP